MLKNFTRTYAPIWNILSVRALLSLSLVMFLATVVSVTVVLLDLRHKELKHARGETVSLTRVLAEQTTRTFEGVVLTMYGIRERLSDNVGQHLDLDSATVQYLLRLRSAGMPQVKSIFLVDRRGAGVNSSRPDFIRQLRMDDREFFSHFLNSKSDGIFISRPEKAHVDGQWTYYVSIRMLDASGQFRGVLVASVSIDYFEALYESIGLDQVSQIRLLRLDGTLMAGKPHDEDLLGKVGGNPASMENLARSNAGGIVEADEYLDGQKRMIAYHRVEKYPLVISAAVDEEDALASWRQMAQPVIAGAIVVLLFVLTTTVLMLRNLLRKLALESALKDSDEQLRHMVQSIRDAIVTINADMKIVLFNDAAEQLFGISASEAIDRDIGELLCRCSSPQQSANLKAILDNGMRLNAGQAASAIIELAKESQEIPVEMSLSTSRFRGALLLTAIFRDLSERRRAELELLETNQQLQELSASLQSVREEARTRIARELHDELGQLLTGIRMEVSWFGGRLLPEQQVLAEKVRSVKTQIDQTIASVRRIASELRPLVLDDLGFAAAASWYVDQFSERTGLSVELMLPEQIPECGEAIATALFRVLQESLTNVARHARATKVEVRLSYAGSMWSLSVRDDGVGFTYNPSKRRDIGLIGMRERIHILGGRFTITTAPGQGTLVDVVIPATTMQEAG